MKYYFNTTMDLPFEQTVEKVKATLKEKGFGILTEIDIKQTLKDKLDVDFRPYHILGACNPPFAHKALLAEDKIGTMLPCNVIIQETEDGKIEVSAIDPVASMMSVRNEALKDTAENVRSLLKEVVEDLSEDT